VYIETKNLSLKLKMISKCCIFVHRKLDIISHFETPFSNNKTKNYE